MQILTTLLTVAFRKLFSKNDITAGILMLAGYVVLAYLCFVNFEKMSYYYYLFFTTNLFYHQKRQDLDLLKIHKHYKLYLLAEYSLYSLPFLLVLFLKGAFLGVLVVVLVYYLFIQLPKFSTKTFKYPFTLVDPHWHITFRQYRLVWFLPVLLLVSFMGIKHNNINLHYFVLGLLSLVCCLPSFERERLIELKSSPLSAKEYIDKQLKNTLLNSAYLLVPFTVVLSLITKDLSIALATVVLLSFPVINTVFKYYYFNSPTVHKMLVGLSFISFGITILAVPFFYFQSIKKLNRL